MSDGLNDARAMRIAELMSDFRNLQYYLAQLRVAPTAEEYYLEGYALLRQCVAEAQAVLNAPFLATSPAPGGNPEKQKQQLRSVLIDASVRRFQCQRSYLRSHAALRWVNSRNAILRGQKPHAGNLTALQTVDNSLRLELAAISDEHVENTLRSQDSADGKWLAEDPSLATIQQVISSRR